MRLRGIVMAACAVWGTSAAAQQFESCTKSEMSVLSQALTGSKVIALKAAANVGNNKIFERWFGKFTPSHGELVRNNLKAVVTAIRTGQITAECQNVGDDACDSDTYAWVYPDEPYLIHFCPNFFTLPTMAELAPRDPKSENGTREGTVIHEISHFFRVASTDDLCYSRDVCTSMAERRPRDAVNNADSYQYFTEDITYFFVDDPLATISAANEERSE